MKLTGKERRYLRSLGHPMKPILQIGKDGLSEEFLSNLEESLDHHELLKIKVRDSAPSDKKGLAMEIERATGGVIAQIIGKTLLFYRPFKEEPEIRLPKK